MQHCVHLGTVTHYVTLLSTKIFSVHLGLIDSVLFPIRCVHVGLILEVTDNKLENK